MMKDNGQFIVPNNTKVECEFPCPECGKKVKGVFEIKPKPYADEKTGCNDCNISYDVTVLINNGTGLVHVDSLEDQKPVKAQGLP